MSADSSAANLALGPGAAEEPSERLANVFVLVFLVVLAFCMIMSHQMGHKFHVRTDSVVLRMYPFGWNSLLLDLTNRSIPTRGR